jgi:hypothetical protein
MKAPVFVSGILRFAFTCLVLFIQPGFTYSQSWTDINYGIPSYYAVLAGNGNDLYMAYINGNTSSIAVNKFNGINWVPVGNPDFSPAYNFERPSLAFNGGMPYIAYTDENYRPIVMRFDGSNWVLVGSPAFSADEVYSVSLAFNGATPYIAYTDVSTGGAATVMRFDGSNWVPVGSPGFSGGYADRITLAFNGGMPYVAYVDANAIMTTVMRFDGSSWVPVGSPGLSSNAGGYASLVFNGGTPYVACTIAGKAAVMRFDGVNWAPVGNPGFSANTVFGLSFAFGGNTPFVAYADYNKDNKATVMRFDGTNWVPVGDPGFSTGHAWLTSLAVIGSTPFITYLAVSGPNPVKGFLTPASGLQFDGVNDYINVPAHSTLNFGTSDFTVECWTKKLGPSFNHLNSGVVGKWNSTSLPGNEWLLQNTSDGNNNIPSFLIESGGVSYVVNGTTSMTLSTWYHLAAVREGNSLKIYVNGVLEGTTTLPANAAVNNAGVDMKIGGFRFNTGASNVVYSNIALDELRIWNRAICQSGVEANMNCQVNPALTTGLVAYYRFDQGYIDIHNPAITTATDASDNNNHGTLANFASEGQAFNWVTGTISGNCVPVTAAAGGPQICKSASAQVPETIYEDGTCNFIARLSPSGAAPVSGAVNACVKIDASVQTNNGAPYVQRHYDIEPAAGAATATGTVTLAFTQADFNAYNTARGSYPALPTGPSDAAGIANLRITQIHGTGTAPNNYTGTAVLINPDDANIVWNATELRWEVTFDVTGFSGFYAHTTHHEFPLAVKLLSFTARRATGFNLLKWITATEEHTDRFEVERKTGNVFEKIGSVKAVGNSSTETRYTYEDRKPFTGIAYYRLRIVDRDGHEKYSNTAMVEYGATVNIKVYPNPAQNILYADGIANGTIYHIRNSNSQLVHSGRFYNATGIDVSALPAGMYVMVIDEMLFKFFKL